MTSKMRKIYTPEYKAAAVKLVLDGKLERVIFFGHNAPLS